MSFTPKVESIMSSGVLVVTTKKKPLSAVRLWHKPR